jgi:hypothetical protein
VSYQRAIQRLADWRADPVLYAYEEFGFEPDEWQQEVLRMLPDPNIQRISMQACVGPGKSAILAIAGWWGLSCWGGVGEHPKGAAVSITHDNLLDNLWAELAKWRLRSRTGYTNQAFRQNDKQISAVDHPQTWFMSARSWPKSANPDEQGETLSGLHSEYVIILIDESGAIPVPVLKRGDQALSNVKRGWILQAGNPVSQDGMLYAAATRLRNQWSVVKITGDPEDPKRSPRVDIEWAREQIKQYGRSDPWVKAAILGDFPPAPFNALLSLSDVEKAMARAPKEEDFNFAPKIMAADVGRGGPDASVITMRQGCMMFPQHVLRGVDGPTGAGYMAHLANDWHPDAIFVDDTGGFGGSWIDSLRLLGYDPIGVTYSAKATSKRYANKRSEMWHKAAAWIKEHGCLPQHCPELVADLTEARYGFSGHGDSLLMEHKDLMSVRLGRSPDWGDSFVETFAEDVAPSEMHPALRGARQPASRALTDRDPYYELT